MATVQIYDANVGISKHTRTACQIPSLCHLGCQLPGANNFRFLIEIDRQVGNKVAYTYQMIECQQLNLYEEKYLDKMKTMKTKWNENS